MGSGRLLGLSRSPPSCLTKPAHRTDFVHGLLWPPIGLVSCTSQYRNPKGSSQVAFSLVDLRRLRPRKHVVVASAVGRRPADTPPTGIPSYEGSTIQRGGRVAARLSLECVDRMYLNPRQRRVPAARRRRGKLLASGGGLQGCPAGGSSSMRRR